jgi:single-stranded-DNA-specific exonuclease
VARDLTLVSSAIIGRTREHRRLVVRDARQQEQTVMWWRSADQAVPEGKFDLAYTIGIHRFRGQENVQLTWVDARIIDRPVIPTMSERRLAVTDYRYHDAPKLALEALFGSCVPQSSNSIVVWAEGRIEDGVPARDRTELDKADTLVVWTIPPEPTVLHDVLETVSPQHVVLAGIDPGLDAPQAFLQRLAGLVKYTLRRQGGRVALSTLAAAMAHGEWTVRLGLEWMEQQGQVAMDLQDRWISLRQGHGQTGQRLHIIQGQLLAQLQETAAYRAYFVQADAQRLVNP